MQFLQNNLHFNLGEGEGGRWERDGEWDIESKREKARDSNTVQTTACDQRSVLIYYTMCTPSIHVTAECRCILLFAMLNLRLICSRLLNMIDTKEDIQGWWLGLSRSTWGRDDQDKIIFTCNEITQFFLSSISSFASISVCNNRSASLLYNLD